MRKLDNPPSQTKEYFIWHAMRNRCSNPKNPNYRHYGGRGIIVCERWQNNFAAFLLDMGNKPDGMWIDRINVNGNYEPTNCKWATPKEQINNRRLKLIENFSDGELLAELARRGL